MFFYKKYSGTYSCLNLDVFFARSPNYYFIQVYIPVAMLVIISWIGFWVDVKKDLASRMMLVLGSLLTMSALVAFLNATIIPQISYTKRIDIWTGVSLTFVFAALLELATVNYFNKRVENAESDEPAHEYKMIKTMKKLKCNKLDVFSRVAFPLAYLLFAIVYVIGLSA